MAKSAFVQHFSTEIRTKKFELPRISRSLTALRATWWSPRCANPHRRGGRQRVWFPPASRWRHLLGRSFFFTTNGTCMGHWWDIYRTFKNHLWDMKWYTYIILYAEIAYSHLNSKPWISLGIGSINHAQLQIYGILWHWVSHTNINMALDAPCTKNKRF